MPARTDKKTRDFLARLAVLYRVQRDVEKIGVLANNTDQRFVEDVANRMLADGLLERDGTSEHMRLSQQGRKVLGEMVSVFDRTIQLNVFSRVYIGMDLSDSDTDSEGRVLPEVYDPRFGGPDDPTGDDCVDMRLAMLHYLAEIHPDGPQEFDPYAVVFLEKLMDGELESPTFWQNLRVGAVFRDIKDIIDTAKTWRSMHEDEDTAREYMDGLYRAGMIEMRKREGSVCSNCEAPLAIFEEETRARGETLDACPDCGHVFAPPQDEDVVGDCPACGVEIHRGQSQCYGCGARINYALPAGTVEHGTQTTTTVVEATEEDYAWSGGYAAYGYSPVCYYDPYGYPGLFAAGGLVVVGAILF